MSDPPPAPATNAVAADPNSMAAEQEVTSPTKSNIATVAPKQDDPKHQEFHPGCGLAIFSTDLCTSRKRTVAGPPYPPVIVRSDVIPGVVQAASFWQRKFMWQCLCIFPGQGWTVNDLWDASDLHLDTQSFCNEMLIFISRDTYHEAMRFANNWLRAHSERVADVGANMTGFYDPNDPFAIVDKIFNEGERTDFPRTFLWHVANMMQITLGEASRMKEAAATASQVKQLAQNKQPVAVVAERGLTVSGTSAPDVTKPAVTEAIEPTNDVPRKTNRKQKRSRTHKLTTSTESLTTVEPLAATPIPTALPSATHTQPDSQLSVDKKRVPTSGPGQIGGHHNEPTGYVVGHAAGPSMISPSMAPQTLNVPKGMPRNQGSGTYYQPMPQYGRPENFNRVPSGPYVQSPPMAPETMMLGHAGMMVPNMMPPYVQAPHMMAPNMVPMQQHYDPILAQRAMMPQPFLPMPGAYMEQPYMHQSRAPRGVSMGDMTNQAYYSNTMGPPGIDPRVPVPRRATNYGQNTNLLYDPYGGTNAGFRNNSLHSAGKKSSHGDVGSQSVQPRKMSIQGGRSAHSNYNSGGADKPSNGGRYLGHLPMRGNFEDDLSITCDRTNGCHETWIGPNNDTVTELFIGDLPVDAHEDEVRLLFEQIIGISPTNIAVRSPAPSARCHAFVSFASVSEAKTAIYIREHNPRIRAGSVPVSVTVPRRFFQKSLDGFRKGPFASSPRVVPAHIKQQDDGKTRGAARMSSHEEKDTLDVDSAAAGAKPTYSPQDVRSYVRKKDGKQLDHKEPSAEGSPEIRKAKRQQNSPSKKQKPKSKREDTTTKTVAVNKVAKASEGTPDVSSKIKEADATPITSGNAGDESRKILSGTPTTLLTEIPIGKFSTSPLSPSAMVEKVAGHTGGNLSPPSDHSDHQGNLANEEDDPDPRTQVSLGASTANPQSLVTPDLRENTPTALVIEQLIKPHVAPEVVASPPAQSSSLVADEPFIDDYSQNNANVQSAPELLTKPQAVEFMSASCDESKTADQVAVRTFSKVDNIAQQSTVIEESTQPSSQLYLPPQPVLPAITTSETDADKSHNDAVNTPESKINTVKNSNLLESLASASIPITDTVGRDSAQQVLSLHPFANSKAQKKKLKEALKKQQKKEQAEKAEKSEKAKAEKFKAIAKDKGSADTSSKPHKSQNLTTILMQSGADPKQSATGQSNAGQMAQTSKKSKGKGKALKMSEDKLEHGTVDNGKLPGNHDIDRALDPSFIFKANLARNDLTKQGSMAGSVVPLGTVVHQINSPLSTKVPTELPAKAMIVQASPDKTTPAPAAPQLETLPHRPSTPSKDPQLDSTATSAPSPSSPIVSSNHPNDMSISKTPPDDASVTSSATLHPDYVTSPEIPQKCPNSPSKQSDTPTSAQSIAFEDFQTSTPLDGAPKKKKNKHKKRKKPANGSVEPARTVAQHDAQDVGSISSDDGIDEDYDSYDPFTSQMSHIDAIRRAVRQNKNSYIAVTNRAIEDEAKLASTELDIKEKAADEQHKAETRKQFEASLGREIDGYLRENPEAILQEVHGELQSRDQMKSILQQLQAELKRRDESKDDPKKLISKDV